LLNDEPFEVMLTQVLVLDQEALDKNYSFSSTVAAWNHTGIGQIMVERVSSDAIENYGVADLGTQASEPFKSVQ
jgi:UTP--glucose-1-phosphate uridylyltransferase